MNTVTLSSRRHDWETPQALFDALDAEFGFTLDAAASCDNHKCDVYITAEDDALRCRWVTRGAVWLNPPFGPGIGKWVRKAYEESLYRWATVVLLIPARTETSWWHTCVMEATEIRLIKGRLRFSGMTINAPFPSAVVVFRPDHLGSPRFTTMDRILDPMVANVGAVLKEQAKQGEANGG